MFDAFEVTSQSATRMRGKSPPDHLVPEAFEKRCLIGLEYALSLGASPDLVARGMVGLDRPSSHDFRNQLKAMDASPFALAQSLIDCSSERANFLRARIAAEYRDPSSAALSLAGCTRETLRPFRRTLIRQGANHEWIALGLAGCEDGWSFELRSTIDLNLERQFPAHHLNRQRNLARQRIALSLAGCDKPIAHEHRDALHDDSVFLRGCITESLRGCSSDAAHARRQAWLSSSPEEVAWSLVGQEASRDHQLRNQLLKTSGNPSLVLRSLAGCDGWAAWILREKLMNISCVSINDLAASLARCTSDRAETFRERLLTNKSFSPEIFVESMVGIHDPHRAFWPWTRPHCLHLITERGH